MLYGLRISDGVVTFGGHMGQIVIVKTVDGREWFGVIHWIDSGETVQGRYGPRPIIGYYMAHELTAVLAG